VEKKVISSTSVNEYTCTPFLRTADRLIYERVSKSFRNES
jgi:hypothetical protein